jgi:hypothetical protein
MSYDINRFNGTLLVTVDDQTVNSTATDLKFVGRNYAGWGEIANENFLILLENFANSTQPPRAIAGQIWFDSANKKLKFFDGVKFKAASGAESSVTAPAGLASGEFWYDTVNEQVKVWTGTQFVLVGPEKVPVYGQTAAAPASVKDIAGSSQNIVKIQSSGQTIAIYSSTSFTINGIINPIEGFNAIKPGINFINSDPVTGITSSEHRFWGTSANADRLNGFSASDFIRSANPQFSAQVNYKDVGFTVGDQRDFKISVENGVDPIIENTLGKPFIFRISQLGAASRDTFTSTLAGIYPGETSFYELGNAGAKWKSVTADTMTANTFYGNVVGTVTSPNTNTPLTFNNVVMTGNYNQVSTTASFNVNLSGGPNVITMTSGGRGAINNFNIGEITRGSGAFTSLTANAPVTVTANDNSSSPTAGALIVSGGVGISGNLNVGGNAAFLGTGVLVIPVGTDIQRPATPAIGSIRFSTSQGDWEGWDGSQWRGLSISANEDWGQVTGQTSAYVDLGGLR